VLDLKAEKLDFQVLQDHIKQERVSYMFEEMKNIYDYNIQKQWGFLKGMEKNMNKKTHELV